VDQYVVLCDCDPDRQPRDVGYIDDSRADDGRFGLEAWPPQSGGILVTPRKHGDRRSPQELECLHCGLFVRLSDTQAAEIIDLIVRPSPETGEALRDIWGKTLIPLEVYVDDAARSAEVMDEIAGERDPSRPSDVPTVIQYAHFYMIPFIKLCNMVSPLDKRR
jgi:hypothetical protein